MCGSDIVSSVRGDHAMSGSERVAVSTSGHASPLPRNPPLNRNLPRLRTVPMLIQRILLNGGLLILIPSEGQQLIRLVAGLLISIAMLLFNSLTMPFRQLHHNYLSVATNLALCCIFTGDCHQCACVGCMHACVARAWIAGEKRCNHMRHLDVKRCPRAVSTRPGGICVRLQNTIPEAIVKGITGTSSADVYATVMLVFYFAVFVCLLISFIYAMYIKISRDRLESKWSVCTLSPPTFKWRPRATYACFISHYKMGEQRFCSHESVVAGATAFMHVMSLLLPPDQRLILQPSLAR